MGGKKRTAIQRGKAAGEEALLFLALLGIHFGADRGLAFAFSEAEFSGALHVVRWMVFLCFAFAYLVQTFDVVTALVPSLGFIFMRWGFRFVEAVEAKLSATSATAEKPALAPPLASGVTNGPEAE